MSTNDSSSRRPKRSRPEPKGAKAKALSALVHAFATEHRIPEARARLWVSYLMLGGALARANRGRETPAYVIKGGVALELRLRGRARATRDLDLSVDAPPAEVVLQFEEAIAEPYEGFRFRRRGEPYIMPNSAVRLEVSIRYHDAPWNTIQVDLAAHEGPDTQVDLIDALPLAQLGLSGPEQLPCLALPYHIAQKIHAMTQPRSEDGPPNERFRDVVDLLLLAPLVEDVAALRIACNEVFASRATHPWPMDPLVLPAEWREPYSALAIGVGGVDPDFDIAVNGIRRHQVNDPPRWTCRREQARDENIGIEDDPHRGRRPARDCPISSSISSGPQPIEPELLRALATA